MIVIEIFGEEESIFRVKNILSSFLQKKKLHFGRNNLKIVFYSRKAQRLSQMGVGSKLMTAEKGVKKI